MYYFSLPWDMGGMDEMDGMAEWNGNGQGRKHGGYTNNRINTRIYYQAGVSLGTGEGRGPATTRNRTKMYLNGWTANVAMVRLENSIFGH